MFLPQQSGAAPGAGGAPGEQTRGAGAPKYYSLQRASVATNSRNASTVRRDTVNRRQADPPLGATLGRDLNRNSRVGEGSVRYERSGHTSRGRRREEGIGGGAGTGTVGGGGGDGRGGGRALMRSSSQRGRQDRDRRVYASIQPQAPGVVGGQICPCGVAAPHFHQNIIPPLNYTLPQNYSFYTPYGTQLPQQYYTFTHPHQPFIAQAAAVPPPSATASVAYSEHHPNSELYRIYKQSQAQNALPAPSETSELQTGQSPSSREFLPIASAASPSYATYGAAPQVAPVNTLPVAAPLAVPAFQMPMPVGAAGLVMDPGAASALQASVRNSYATYSRAPRALVQNYTQYPQLTVPSTADPATQVVLREQIENRPTPPRPTESLHEPNGNIPTVTTTSAAQPIPSSIATSLAAQSQPTTTGDPIQNATGLSTPSRPLILKDPKCTISFV